MKLKSTLLLSLLATLAASPALAALAELNVADGSIMSPDGGFSGRDFRIVNDFKLELLHVSTPAQGQWVALDWDARGRLLVTGYNTDRLARLTIPRLGSNDPVRVEMLTDTQVPASEGLLWAFNSLYVNANRSNTMRSGLYRLRDTNGDDRFDQTRVLRNLQASGDHGTHDLKLTPDGQRFSMMNGNATRPTEWTRSRVPEVWGEDNLVMRLIQTAPGFNRAPEAHITVYNQDATDIELFAIGMRNPVSHAYNKDGEIFVYDADHEPSMGFTAGYRPTAILHIISGADVGWRAGSRFHPYYYIDNFGTIDVVGSGSPTGGAMGTGTKFPARYQDAYFVCDYSFGLLHAVRLTPDGASYTAKTQPFITGRPFATSGAIVNKADGTLLVMTTGSQLYRVSYVGNEDVTATRPDTQHASFRNQRRELERFHGVKNNAAVGAAWPFLGDSDRAIRHAARTAIEWQDVASWRERALAETDPRRAIAAIVALARVSGNDQFHTPPNVAPNRDKALQNRMFATLDRIDFNHLDFQEKLDLLRAYQLAMIRLGEPDAAARQRLIARFDPLLPSTQREMNWEVSELLVYLQAPSAATKVMGLLKAPATPAYFGTQEWINPQQRQRTDGAAFNPNAPNLGVSQASIFEQEDEIHLVQLLRTLRTGWTPELRREYLTWFTTAPQNFTGNIGALGIIRADAVSQIPTEERAGFQALLDAPIPSGRGRGGLGATAAAGRGGAAPAAAAAPIGTPGLAAPPASLYIPRGGANRAFNDIELTTITRFDETVAAQLKAANDASTAITAAPFAANVTPAAIQAAANAVAEAELNLALARAAGYSKLKADLKLGNDRVPGLVQTMTARGGRGVILTPAAPATTPAPAGAPAPAPASRGGQ